MRCGVKIDGKPCNRLIVPGFWLKWVHLENPGRDHHYALPASRPAADDLAVPGGTTSEGTRLSTEAPGVSAVDPFADLPPSANGVPALAGPTVSA